MNQGDSEASAALRVLVVGRSDDRRRVRGLLEPLTSSARDRLELLEAPDLGAALEQAERGACGAAVLPQDLGNSPDLLESLERFCRGAVGVGVVVVADGLSDAGVEELLRAGAQDCLPWSGLTAERLRRALNHAVLRSHWRERERAARLEAEALTRQLGAIQSVTDAALSHLPVEDLLQELLVRVKAALGAHTATVLLLEEDELSLRVRALSGFPEELEGSVRIPVGRGIAGGVAARREPLLLEDIQTTEVISPWLRKHVRSLLAVPLLVEGKVLGVLHVGSRVPRRFTPEDLRLLQVVGFRVSLLLRNAQLVEEARREREQWQATVESMQEMVTVADAQGRTIYMNAAYLERLGRPIDEGQPPGDHQGSYQLYRPDGTPYEPSELPLQKAALEGQVVRDCEIVQRTAAGEELLTVFNAAPLYNSRGEVTGAVAVGRDLTEQRRAARERERLLAEQRLLADVASALLHADDPRASVGPVCQRVTEHLRCDVFIGFVRDEEQGTLRLHSYGGLTQEDAERIQVVGQEFGALGTSGEPDRCIVLRNGGGPEGGGESIPHSLGLQTIACHPLQARGRFLGTLVFGSRQERGFTDEELYLMRRVADLVATALDRAALHETAVKRAREAEEGSRTLEALLEYVPEGIAIAEAPDLRVRRASRYGVELAGPRDSEEDTPPDGWPLAGSLFHPDGRPPDSPEELPLHRAIQGQTVTNEEWMLRPREGEPIPILFNAGPILDETGRVTGGVVAWRDIRDIKAGQKALEEAYQRERYVAEVLQRALLPQAPEPPPGYDIAARYAPATRHQLVGGDFYDVFELANRGHGIVIGDVSGKGVEAAALAASTRSTLRTLAFEDGSAADAFARANRVLLTQTPMGSFVTVLLVLLDPATGEVDFSCAGHPPAVVVSSSGEVRLLECVNLPLGVLEDAAYRHERARLSPGDTLLLYTDGVLEPRQDGEEFGVERIAEALRAARDAPVDQGAEAVLNAAREWSRGTLADDAAVVVLRRLRAD